MSAQWRIIAGIATTIAFVLGLCGTAHAVSAVGAAMRIDPDPGTSEVHQFGVYYTIRTPTGGFVVAWEENTESESPDPIVYEGVRFRVYDASFAPVAGPRSASIPAGRRLPGLIRIAPLGADKAYLLYALTRDNNSLDHPVVREAFGQPIALATGATTGTRRLLNPPATGIWDSLTGIASGLADGRAVFGWYEADEVEPAPGRFISSADVPQAVDLDFACCGSNREARLVRLQPLGAGFLAVYIRNSIFGNNGIYARILEADGQPLGADKRFAVDPLLSPIPKALSNGNIAVFRDVLVDDPGGDYHRIVAQLHDENWDTIGLATVLVSNRATSVYTDFEPTLDGGLFMIRTMQNGSTYTRTVRRYDADLHREGPDYTFAATQFDGFRIAALSDDRAVVVFRNIVNGRHRLYARILSY